MKIENQVNTLKQGKELLKLGITARPMLMHSEHLEGSVVTLTDTGVHFMAMDYAPAFTVAEMRAMIGIGYVVATVGWCSGSGNPYDLYQAIRSPQLQDVGHYEDSPNTGRKFLTNVWSTFDDDKPKTDGDAHGRLLIYLLENKIITAEEVNQRLTNA